jgi:hypothetical protein
MLVMIEQAPYAREFAAVVALFKASVHAVHPTEEREFRPKRRGLHHYLQGVRLTHAWTRRKRRREHAQSVIRREPEAWIDPTLALPIGVGVEVL